MTDAAATVYVVDDDTEVLKALQRLLAAAGFATAGFASPRVFLDHVDDAAAGCVVLDLAMPDVGGLELQRELEARGLLLPVVFLTGRGDVPSSVQAMKRGAIDFLTKPVDDAALIAAVASALERNRELRDERLTKARTSELRARLTARELELLRLVVAGRLNKQIAAELGVVEPTVKFHRANLMRKLGARTVADLVRFAQVAGID